VVIRSTYASTGHTDPDHSFSMRTDAHLHRPRRHHLRRKRRRHRHYVIPLRRPPGVEPVHRHARDGRQHGVLVPGGVECVVLVALGWMSWVGSGSDTRLQGHTIRYAAAKAPTDRPIDRPSDSFPPQQLDRQGEEQHRLLQLPKDILPMHLRHAVALRHPQLDRRPAAAAAAAAAAGALEPAVARSGARRGAAATASSSGGGGGSSGAAAALQAGVVEGLQGVGLAELRGRVGWSSAGCRLGLVALTGAVCCAAAIAGNPMMEIPSPHLELRVGALVVPPPAKVDGGAEAAVAAGALDGEGQDARLGGGRLVGLGVFLFDVHALSVL
jgi:hypothetical protein